MRKILVAVQVPSRFHPAWPEVKAAINADSNRCAVNSSDETGAVVEMVAIDNSPIATNRGASKGKSARTVAN